MHIGDPQPPIPLQRQKSIETMSLSELERYHEEECIKLLTAFNQKVFSVPAKNDPEFKRQLQDERNTFHSYRKGVQRQLREGLGQLYKVSNLDMRAEMERQLRSLVPTSISHQEHMFEAFILAWTPEYGK